MKLELSDREPKSTRWTFRPDADVASLVSKELNRLAKKHKRRGKPFDRRGLRSAVLNERLRRSLAELVGKREGNLT